MSGARTFFVVAIVVLVLMLAIDSFAKTDYRERNSEIFTEMAYSVAAESFSKNEVLPGGMTMQPLVAGVIPRGAERFPYSNGPEEAVRAGKEWTSPISDPDDTTLQRGRELYAIYCTLCHGPTGDGDGTVTLRGMVRPPSLHAARAMQMADGEMYHIMTKGQGNMASYAAQVSPLERWQIILHVRNLQEQSK
jgi:mono/diheme cytochrome c family protein